MTLRVLKRLGSDKLFKFLSSPLTRISFGLAMLTISLLLVCDMLGLYPDLRQAELEQRKFIAESVALQVSLELDDTDRIKLQQILRSVLQNGDRLHSLAVVNQSGMVIAQAGDHENLWSLADDAESTMDQVRVELFDRSGSRGAVEYAFKPLAKLQHVLGGGADMAWLLLYMALAGFLGYYLFLRKVLKELNPGQVLPDRVRTALDTLSEGLLILDNSGQIMFANAALADRLGVESSQLIGKLSSSLNWHRVGTDVKAEIADLPWMQTLAGKKVPRDQILDLNVAGKMFRYGVNTSPIAGDDNTVRGVLITLSDLTEVERKRRELETALSSLRETQQEITRKNSELFQLATRDSLTNVLNRRAFFEAFDSIFAEAHLSQAALGCIMVDIDHFKSVNDNFGHSMGDSAICYLVSVMQTHARDTDLVGRFGGEEFCILIPGGSLTETIRMAEKIRISVENGEDASFLEQFQITASFGVAALPAEVNSPQELLDRADRALYYAKENGRNLVASWTADGIHRIVDDAGADRQADRQETSQVKERKSAPMGAVKVDQADQVQNAGLLPAPDRASHDARGDASVSQSCGESYGESRWESRWESRRAVDPPTAQRQDGELYLRTAEGAQVIVDSDFSIVDRQLLLYNIDQAIHRSRVAGSEVAVVVLDTAPLQQISDAAGYHLAMKLGAIMVDRLKSSLRGQDIISQGQPENPDHQNVSTVARIDNNAVVILASDIDKVSSIPSIVRRIVKLFDRSFAIEGNDYHVEANLGVAIHGVDGGTAEQILQNACIACSDAKTTGRGNTYRFFSPEMDKTAKRELRVQSDLPNALERGELAVKFQPKVSLSNGSIVGFEALLRWQHPELGFISPTEFIPLAEKSNLIGRINSWVVCVVADQLESWQLNDLPETSVAINLSAVELRDDTLAEQLIDAVNSRQLKRHSVEVEITESLGIDSTKVAGETLQKLSDAGFVIAIDDFGTGYASLNYLQRFPIQRVKIDKTFVDGIATDVKKQHLIKAIISMSTSLGMKVLAEGVETEEQLILLQEFYCHEIQGYLMSRPVDAETATQLLRNHEVFRQRVLAAEFKSTSIGLDSGARLISQPGGHAQDVGPHGTRTSYHRNRVLPNSGLGAIVNEFPVTASNDEIANKHGESDDDVDPIQSNPDADRRTG